MISYVVDASVAAKWFLEEPFTDHAARLFDPEHWLYVPDFVLLELDSVFCRRVRRGQISEAEADAARARLLGLPLSFVSFVPLRDTAFGIAVQTQRSPYDCLYLALAIRLRAKLVTADRRFYDAISTGPHASHILWIEDV